MGQVFRIGIKEKDIFNLIKKQGEVQIILYLAL